MGWSHTFTVCSVYDSPWGQISQKPANGVTVMTSGSETQGILLVNPPSQQLCRRRRRRGRGMGGGKGRKKRVKNRTQWLFLVNQLTVALGVRL